MRQLRAWLTAITLALAAAVLTGPRAFAKKVSIAWEPIPGAKSYEIQIEQDDHQVVDQVFAGLAWGGNLPNGFYVYKIRGIDRVKRPGEWTESMPLVVLPGPPGLLQPEAGKKFVRHRLDAPLRVQWAPTPGVRRYNLEVLNGQETVHTEVIEGTEATLRTLPPGHLSWSVRALIEPSGRVPASAVGRQWPSKPSASRELTIEDQMLTAPIQVSPRGLIERRKERRLTLEWKKVEGAEAYEIEFARKPVGPQAVAFAPDATIKIMVRENVAVIPLPGDGAYVWRVRALADLDGRKLPEAVGPPSIAEFNLGAGG